MPTFVYSRKKDYWRPLCRNQLQGETSLPSSVKALPCKVCLYPEELPPIQGCWCNTTTRPQGVDTSLIFTIGSALGSDSIGGTALTNTGSRTYTNAHVTLDATMLPADGAKSTVIANRCQRDWISASGTTFIAKNLSRYLPQATGNIPCGWVALAGMHYVERLYHPTIITSKNAQTFTYNDGTLKTGRFWDFNVAAPGEIVKRDITLNNNDPGSVWLGVTGSADYAKIRAWVPQVATGMSSIVGGICQPVTCNNTCYPVSGHCWSNAAILATDISSPSSAKKWFSYWKYRTTVNGYYWVVKRHTSGAGVWLAWLMGRDVQPWTEVNCTRPFPGTVAAYQLYAFTNENVPDSQPGGNNSTLGWHYPASYHSSIPSFHQPGIYRSDAPGYVTTGTNGVFGGGMTGSARHSSWSGSIFSVFLQSQAPRGYQTDIPLACYATDNLACNFSGTTSMQKIADYRTAPNAALGPIDAGPSSFPSSATLTF